MTDTSVRTTGVTLTETAAAKAAAVLAKQALGMATESEIKELL